MSLPAFASQKTGNNMTVKPFGMKQTLVSIVLFLSLILVFQACNKASLVGYDLFAGDQIGTEFTDTMTITALTELGDSVRTYAPGVVALNAFLWGDYYDQVVGRARSVIHAQLRLDGTAPDFSTAVLDSAVLALPYDTTAFYGRTNQTFGMQVYSLQDGMNADSTYYSDTLFGVSQLLGIRYFEPVPDENVMVLRPNKDHPDELDTLFFPAQARIPVDYDFANSLLHANVFDQDTSLLSYFPGVQISPSLTNDGMLAFDLNSSDAGLIFYYHIDTIYNSYRLRFGTARMTSFLHDYTGSLVESYLNDSIKGEEYLFLQGMQGTRLKLNIPYAETLRDSLINHVSLEMTVVPVPEDGGMAPPPIDQVVLSRRNEDGQLVVIDDVVFGLERNALSSFFGGVPSTTEPYTYELNLTSHFMQMRRGEVPAEIYVTVLFRNSSAARMVLGGPSHPDYPMKLKVYYTPL